MGGALCLLSAQAAAADPADAILGDWLVASRDAVVRIERHGDEFEGHLVWQLHDTYGPEDGPELLGRPVVDRNNPDPAQRARLLDGLRLMWDLHYDPQRREWRGGRIYNADDGHTYHCLIRLLDADHLRLRGYIGITLLGGSTVWSRSATPAPLSGESPPHQARARAGEALLK